MLSENSVLFICCAWLTVTLVKHVAMHLAQVRAEKYDRERPR